MIRRSARTCPARLIGLLALCLAMNGEASAGGPFEPLIALDVGAGVPLVRVQGSDSTGQHLSRALAAALAVTLGPFGAHRLYLGTRPGVPLIYGLTFGGFGVLVLLDLGHVLFTKDLTRFRENDRVLMWAVPHKEESVTPP